MIKIIRNKLLVLQIILLLIAPVFLSCTANDNKFVIEDEMAYEVEFEENDTLMLLEEEVLPETADQLFVDFFFNFVTNEDFQYQRIVFPLKYNDGDTVVSLNRRGWADFNKFDSLEYYSVLYEREQDLELQNETNIDIVTVEWINLDEMMNQRFNFKRVLGKWKLINVINESTLDGPNGIFIEFYKDFSRDSLFQIKSLKKPLRLVSYEEEDSISQYVEEIGGEVWRELISELPLPNKYIINIDFGQTSISMNRKVFMIEGISNGLYVKYRFDKNGNSWCLKELEI